MSVSLFVLILCIPKGDFIRPDRESVCVCGGRGRGPSLREGATTPRKGATPPPADYASGSKHTITSITTARERGGGRILLTFRVWDSK